MSVRCAFAAFAIFTVALALLFGSGAPPASASVTNGTFDSDTTGWSTAGGGVTLAHNGSVGNPAGSAQVTLTAIQPAYSQGIGQCTPATAGVTYDLSADVMVPTGAPQASDTVAFMTRSFSSAADCQSGPLGGGQTSNVTPSNSFQTISLQNMTAPAGTQAMNIVLWVNGTPTAIDAPHAFFDNVSFEPDAGANTATPTNTAINTSTPTNTPVAPTNTPVATTTSSSRGENTSTTTVTRTSTPSPGGSAIPTLPAHATPARPGGGAGGGGLQPPDTGSGNTSGVTPLWLWALAWFGAASAATGLALRTKRR